MLDFNYNSNHLEDNTLTYGQTKLLFLFGETAGNANLKDYEEMKAHNVGLEMIKREAFEDGNGRIARLLVNYILLKNNYPMIVIKSKEKDSYLKVLHQCDVAVGIIPSDGALAKLKQVKPFVDFIESKVIQSLSDNIKMIKDEKGGTINSIWWYNENRITIKNINQQYIIELLIANSNITVRDLSEKLNINKSAIQKHLAALKTRGYISRKGGTKGEWIVNIASTED